MNNEKFTPLTASHGNISGEISHVRDTYLDAEYNYYCALLSDEKILEQMERIIEYPPDKLYEEAMARMDAIENGELEKFYGKESNAEEKVHISLLERAEGEIALLLGAIRDKVLIKELVLTLDREDEKETINVRRRGL